MDPNIEQLTDERDVLEAQRDHYRDRCNELSNEINECKKLLQGKLQTSQCDIDPSIFSDESLERLREWQKCLSFCIEEEIERMNLEGKGLSDGDEEEQSKGEKNLKGEMKVNRSRGRFETELPFSPSNLTGFLTKNHKLTQSRTQYPEPRPKNS
jgi:hypothetical protein